MQLTERTALPKKLNWELEERWGPREAMGWELCFAQNEERLKKARKLRPPGVRKGKEQNDVFS